MTPEITTRITEVINDLRVESNDQEAVLRAISKAAVDTIDNAEYASVTLVTRGRIETPVMFGDLAGKCDDLQRELGEGPCVRAAVDDIPVRIDDLANDPRWPRFAAAASALGVASMACFCLYIDGNDFGALNLHSTTPFAFDDETCSLAELFAAHCATTFGAVREKEQLRNALGSRDLIGQAKGMLMERYRIDADAAFLLLARLSQESNTKLVDVAANVVVAGPGN